MSSRVQKGGQKFKPVAKPRGRQNEGIPSRKPPSVRGSTQEPFRTQLAAPHESQSHNNDPQILPSTAGQSLLGQTEGPSHAPPQKPPSTSRDTRSNKPTSSRSTGGANRDAEIATNSQERNGTPVMAISIPTRASDIYNSVPSRPATSITPSRLQPTLVSKPSMPVIQNTLSSVSQAASLPKSTPRPPPHESLPNYSNEVSQSTLVGTLPNEALETESTATERHGEYSMAPNNAEAQRDVGPSQTQRKTRRRAKKSVVESDVEGGEMTDRTDSDVEKRMIRNRRISKITSEPGNSNAKGDSTENPRQLRKRARRSSTQQSTEDGQPAVAPSGAEDSESDTQGRDKRRRRSVKSSSSTSTGRKHSRNPTTPILFDPDAGPGEELDPTVITMAEICGDTGQGRISSKGASIQRNHLAWKAANKDKREKMRAAMEAKKYGRKEDDDRAKNESSEAVKEPTLTENAETEENTSQIAESSGTPAVEDASGSGFNYRESLAVNRFSAQIRIGPNGETIIDEESLFVDRADGADEGIDNYQHVEESDQTKFTNSATYSRKARGSRWSAEETELFFDALSQFGENYELISYVLPGRDRKSCKNKFKAEDKKNSNRITFCLNNRIPYDMQTLSRLTGKDFSGPTPEIIAPEIPAFVDEPREVTSEAPSETEKGGRKARKKSRTPATSDVEVMGDVGTFDMGISDS